MGVRFLRFVTLRALCSDVVGGLNRRWNCFDYSAYPLLSVSVRACGFVVGGLDVLRWMRHSSTTGAIVLRPLRQTNRRTRVADAAGSGASAGAREAARDSVAGVL